MLDYFLIQFLRKHPMLNAFMLGIFCCAFWFTLIQKCVDRDVQKKSEDTVVSSKKNQETSPADLRILLTRTPRHGWAFGMMSVISMKRPWSGTQRPLSKVIPLPNTTSASVMTTALESRWTKTCPLSGI